MTTFASLLIAEIIKVNRFRQLSTSRLQSWYLMLEIEVFILFGPWRITTIIFLSEDSMHEVAW